MKRILLLIVGFLIVHGLAAGQYSQNQFNIQNMGYELDQYQENMTEVDFIPVGHFPFPIFDENQSYIQVAQSFIPTKEILTKVELYLAKNETATVPLRVSIREELSNEDLTYIDIDPDLFPTEDFEWLEFNFDDIVVATGDIYFIVTVTENVSENFYGWAANNKSDSYPFGCAWISLDNGDTWTNQSVHSHQYSADSKMNQHSTYRFKEIETWNMCFRTYGRDNQAPEKPSITGPTTGKAGVEYSYNFSSIDPEGDAVYYFIDWGDETNTGWIGCYPSGEEITQSHVWSEQGTYAIKAKSRDVYGAESDWETFAITMPLNLPGSQQISLGFNQAFQNLIYNIKLRYAVSS